MKINDWFSCSLRQQGHGRSHIKIGDQKPPRCCVLACFSGTLARTAWPDLAQPRRLPALQLNTQPWACWVSWREAAPTSGGNPKEKIWGLAPALHTAPGKGTGDKAVMKMLCSGSCWALAAAAEHAQTHLPWVQTCLWAGWTNMKSYLSCQMPPALPQTQPASAVAGGHAPVTLLAECSSSPVTKMQLPIAFRSGCITCFPVLKEHFHLHCSSGG